MGDSQDAPKPNDNAALWPLLMEEVRTGNSSFAVEYVIPDMEKRHQKGLESYGVALQPHNGRDALLDAYEEALDMAVYLKQACVENPHRGYFMFYREALNLAISLRAELYLRDGS